MHSVTLTSTPSFFRPSHIIPNYHILSCLGLPSDSTKLLNKNSLMEKIHFYFSSIAFAYLGEEKRTLLSRLFYNTVNAGF